MLLIQIKPGRAGTSLLRARSPATLARRSKVYSPQFPEVAKSAGFVDPASSQGLVVLFGTGAAVGAVMTKQTPTLTLGIPVIALLVVLLHCETERTTGRLP